MTNEVLESFLVFLAAAVISVPLSRKLGLGSVLGYIIAGLAIGPSGLGLIQTVSEVMHFSEIGIVLFLFLVGIELQPRMLWTMRRSVLGGGGAQLSLSILGMAGLLFFLPTFSSQWQAIAIAAFALALSSTAIALQVLDEKNMSTSQGGKLAFSILLLQDLAAIPLLAALPFLTGTSSRSSSLSWWQQGLLVALWLGASLSVVPRLLNLTLRQIAAVKAADIFTSFSLLFVIGMALTAQNLGLSMGLGSFLAGVILADSEYKHALESNIEPFKGLLLGIFFIAVGMSLDLTVVSYNIGAILRLVLPLMAIKFAVMTGLNFSQGIHASQSRIVAWSLVPVSEFAFVVITSATHLGLFNEKQGALLTSAAVFSMVLSPLALFVNERLLQLKPKSTQEPTFDTVESHDHPVIIAGFGRWGQIVGRFLFAHQIKATVLDIEPEQIEMVRRFGFKVYYGDATRLDLLQAAGIDKAKVLVAGIDDMETNLKLVDLVRHSFPHIKIFSRARNMQHVYELMDRGIDNWERETFDSSLRMAGHILTFLGAAPYIAHRSMYAFRQHNLKLIASFYKIRHDRDELTSQARLARDQLEKVISEDLHSMHLGKEGWEGEKRPERL